MRTLSPTADTAIDIVVAAGTQARAWYDKGAFTVDTKADGSPVSEADRQVESALRAALQRSFPADGIVGEEFPETIGTSAVRWVVDPIDGTKQFVRGVPQYATLLAREVDGHVDLGVIYLPSLDILMVAEEGRGCWRGDVQVHVSERDTLEGAYVLANWLETWPPDALPTLQAQGALVRTWGDAFGYLMVASGQAEAVVDCDAKVYDLGPMPVIMAEAGGVFSALDGNPSHALGSGIGSNGLLHEAVREIVR
ncbi:MAG: inositol monophosphatase family protein [Nocardioidaceae bacterium]